jgi:outer membrane autotransporter protein
MGNGGNAVEAYDGGTIVNNGTIQGGFDGEGAATVTGGGGVVGQNLTIVNGGLIAGAGSIPAPAIAFVGGSNRLELRTGYAFTGDVLGLNGSTNTLVFGGGTNAAFDASGIGAAAQFKGFQSVEKTGASTWTLTGVSGFTGNTTIQQGVLRLGQDNALGSGALVVNGGTFQLDGHQQTVSSLSGTGGRIDLAAGRSSRLDVNQAGESTYSGDVTGSGLFQKRGAGTLMLNGTVAGSEVGIVVNGGTLVLTGTNTYGGGTTVSAGTLQVGNGGTTGTLGAGDVVNNATVAFNRSNDLTVANVISGSGGLRKTGAGRLELTGANSYTGGTFIGGELLASADANLGAPTGDIAFSNGTLVLGSSFDLAAGRRLVMNLGSGVIDTNGHDMTVRSALTGNTYFVKDGLGTLTLLGPNSFTGRTILAQGTLVADADSIGKGAIENRAKLVIDQQTDGSMAQTIEGAGSLVKRGAGRLDLTGMNPLTGDTIVQQGNLVVNGSLSASNVTVEASATLSGAGTVGGIAANAGAIITPGNSIGILNVAGNVVLGAGSVYQVEVDGAGQSDRIAATGAATLNGGMVRILSDQGQYALSPYTILTADAGVAGQFAGTEAGADFAFVTPTLGYGPNAVTLTLVRKVDPQPPVPPTPETPTPPVPPRPVAFNSVAATKNQYTTADGVEVLGAGNSLFDTVIGSSVAGARQAFDALSGEAHASAVNVAYADSRLVREAILTRLRQPLTSGVPTFVQGSYGAAYAADAPEAAPQPVAVVPSFEPGRFTLWGEGFGSWGHARSNGNAAGLETSTGGFILGADAQVSDAFRFGLAGGFTRTSFDIDGRLSSGANESVFGALYGSGSWGGFTLRLGAAYAWHDIEVNRAIRFLGFSEQGGTSYDGWTAQAFAEVGYRMDLGPVQLEPFAGASVLRLHTDAFQEEGGAAALTGYAWDQDLATTTLGLRAEARLSAEVPLIARVLVGWRHAYGNVEPEALLAFSSGASVFTVAGVPIDRDALVAEAGLDWQASEAISLEVAYSGQIGSRAQEHALKGSFTWRFNSY